MGRTGTCRTLKTATAVLRFVAAGPDGATTEDVARFLGKGTATAS